MSELLRVDRLCKHYGSKVALDDVSFTLDSGKIVGEDEKTYLAIYFEDKLAWEVMGKSYYVADQINNWMSDLASSYTVNQRVLNRIGTPTPTTTATTAA